jgi:CRISPR-associated exonuclease Cas4
MPEQDLWVPISGLQHMVYCERQAALIHVERIWLDNSFTVEGQDLHRRVDSSEFENRPNLRVRRGVALHSDRLGLTGKADLVEFQRSDDFDSGVTLPGEFGLWRVVPVEYKRGKPKPHDADDVQLCAQALCLEEMFGARIPDGLLFYGRTRRRHPVRFTEDLRARTEATVEALRRLMRAGRTPVRRWERKCQKCSLLPVCLPPRRTRPKSVERYLEDSFANDPTRSEHV